MRVYEGLWMQKEFEGFEDVYINGNTFHDPLRLSVSIKYYLLNEKLREQNKRSSSFYDLIKTKYKICVSGAGDWRFLDLLPRGGKENI